MLFMIYLELLSRSDLYSELYKCKGTVHSLPRQKFCDYTGKYQTKQNGELNVRVYVQNY